MGYDDTATAEKSAAAIETALSALAGPLIGKDEVSVERDLFDQGATSLSFTRLLVAIKQRFAVTVDVGSLDGDASLRRLALTIHSELTESAA